MKRLTALFVLAGAGFVLSPATASAQFGFGYGYQRYGGPVVTPTFNPFFAAPQYRYQQTYGLSIPTTYGNLTFGSRYYSYGYFNPAWSLSPLGGTFYSQNGSYMSGSVRPSFAQDMQRDIQRAQRAAGLPGANGADRNSSSGTAVVPAPIADRVPNLPAGFEKELSPVDRTKVLSGEALNSLLVAIAKAELRNVERPSAFVSPLQLEEVRFGGSDAADALNLVLRPLDFPSAFDDPSLKDLRLALARDFAPLATAIQAGKSPEATKRTQFEATLAKMEAALAPVIRDIPFADSTAARRFMNQLAGAAKAMKVGADNGLVDTKWASEGTTVANFAKHMTRHQLQFAAAPAGSEETYFNLHRNLATYLFLLAEQKK
ncbi:hypothetical protein GobsT_42620 [Gemmata obscuriglobus]|nr:hypothetical protein [Gemmata obscuriglobus]QEG29466.1 hypothetical protein GobsT_42620 [Gemmata obscuriglobus]VTS08605.1 unnamed protein product [Gemmata obscuriglobus UQM 2246]